jgi:hypothetical protein
MRCYAFSMQLALNNCGTPHLACWCKYVLYTLCRPVLQTTLCGSATH